MAQCWMIERIRIIQKARRIRHFSLCFAVSLYPCLAGLLSLILLSFISTGRAPAGDLGTVPLLDGERNDSLNLWGGQLGLGNALTFIKESSVVHSGTGAYQANLGTITNGGFEFFQTFSSSLPSNASYRQDRDL